MNMQGRIEDPESKILKLEEELNEIRIEYEKYREFVKNRLGDVIHDLKTVSKGNLS